MRILMGIHHPLDPNLGAPGVTLALGSALSDRGCEVSYFSYHDAYPHVTEHSSWHNLRFPWDLTRYLVRAAGSFDVVDVTTGDAYLWASLGRPGHKPGSVLVTRSHGLEHVVSDQLRADARQGLAQLSWKYPLYYGGFRLWEVRQSLRRADHVVLLNEQDRAYSRDRLGVPDERLSVIAHGLSPVFQQLKPPVASSGDLKLAFVGTWIQRKGIAELTAIADRLLEEQIPFQLLLLGTGGDEASLWSAFSVRARDRVRAVPRYVNTELPQLLQGQEVLLFPSHAEGFGMALVEAMACGLAAVTTPVGVASSLVQNGIQGHQVQIGDVKGFTQAVKSLHKDRSRLYQMRQAAQQAAQKLTWKDAAKQTEALYARLVARRHAG